MIAFRALREAVTGAERNARDYDNVCEGVRAMVEAYLDSDKVLGRLIEEIDIV
jgi:hypothetical protein